MILKIILKSAIFEIKYLPKVPFKVVIDEYLAVTEMYYDSGQKALVNGVLDSVYKSKM
jgi:transcription antitermination protein NusB